MATEMACFASLKFLFDNNGRSKGKNDILVPLLTTITEDKIRVEDYWEKIVPLYSDNDFQRVFRMTPSTLEALCRNIFPYMDYGSELFLIPHEKKIMIAVYYFGHQESYFLIAEKFNVAESTVKRTVDAVSDALVNYAKQVIKWPNGIRIQECMEKFEEQCNFPNVVGAIDGCHIQIKTPSEDKECYYNRKKFFSIVLQAICNADLLFLDCFTGYPGSVHDSRVFKSSGIYQKIKANTHLMFPDNSHLLGDCAYQLEPWLMTPFRDNGLLSQRKKRYNYLLSKTRVAIERSFALLKGRYRRLKYMDMNDIARICSVIMACCVLHNHCVLHEDVDEDFMDETDINDLHLGDNLNMGREREDENAKLKREQIMNQILAS